MRCKLWPVRHGSLCLNNGTQCEGCLAITPSSSVLQGPGHVLRSSSHDLHYSFDVDGVSLLQDRLQFFVGCCDIGGGQQDCVFCALPLDFLC
jgi:hypothetical protein